MSKSVAVTFCKENGFKRKLGELSGIGVGGPDMDRLDMWASQYDNVQVTRYKLVELLSEEDRVRTLKQLTKEGVAVGYPEVAVIKNALTYLVPGEDVLNKITDEVFAMKFDNKDCVKGKVKAIKGFHKNRIGEKAALPNIAKGQGTVVAWKEVPVLNAVRQAFRKAWGEKFGVPVADCNLYDCKSGGMGFHGDDDRNVVICLSIGSEGMTRELDFQAFDDGLPIGERLTIPLGHGDIYIMSEKAIGMDWRCKSKITWRHAVGHHQTYRPNNLELRAEQEKLNEKSGKTARKRDIAMHLKNIASDINIGYNKLTRKETYDVIEKSHEVALSGILERMDTTEVNQKDPMGCTPLHWACNSNNHLMVATLLKVPHIQVNSRNNFGYTPLMLAAASCNVKSLKLMLDDPRVDLNVANSDGVPLEKLIGSLCYSCSCSKDFKKQQSILLQMIINEEKEVRKGISNKGLKDVIKRVLSEDKKRLTARDNLNTLSDNSGDDVEKNKNKVEGELGLTLSDDSGDEEKSKKKIPGELRVSEENSVDSEKDPDNEKNKNPRKVSNLTMDDKKQENNIDDENKLESKELRKETEDLGPKESPDKEKKIVTEALEPQPAVNLESILSGMNQTIKDKILVTKVKLSGLRVRQTTVSSNQLDDAIGTRKFIAMSDVGQFCKSIDCDWYTIGVLVKTGQKKNESGLAYTVWRMSDLKGKMKLLSVVLIGRAHKKHLNTPIKKVICLLNAKLMNGGEHLRVEHPDMAIDLGDSVDMGVCGFKGDSPVTCGFIVNRSVSQFCPQHDKKKYEELEQRRLLESSEKASEALRSMKKKSLDKGREKELALAVLAMKNKKTIKKQDPNNFFRKKDSFESREKIRKKVAASLGTERGDTNASEKDSAFKALEDQMMF